MQHRKLLPSATALVSTVVLQITMPLAIAQDASTDQARATSHWNVSGTWKFISNDTPGTLKLQQEPSTERCKKLTGTMDVPNDYSAIIGLYCPSSLRIYIGRYKQGEPSPFQMYEGYVSNGSGKYMAGSFFVWGNEGPAKFSATNPFIGERFP